MTGRPAVGVLAFAHKIAKALTERRRDQSVAFAYAIWSLPLLITLACVVPPWTNTDEPFHMLRGVSLAHGYIIGSRFDNHSHTAPPGSGGLSDPAIFEAFSGLAEG